MTDDERAELLETIPELRGQCFVLKPYTAYSATWDHDHCAVCGVKLMEPGSDGDRIIHEGYAITSEYEHGADYEWVCAECFTASKVVMGWKDATGS